MQTISIISLKGGVAKTTTAVNMAYILAAVHKKKVQGIRGIGYQGTGEQGMGMAAGTAPVTLYGYFVCNG